MQGNINTKNSVLKKFSSSKHYTESIEESVDFDFSASNNDVYDEPNIKTSNSKECRLLGDDDLDIRKKSIKKGKSVIIEFVIIKNKLKPYIMFKLYKKKNTDTLGFVRMHLEDEEIPKINDAAYSGLYEYAGIQFLFFHINREEYTVRNVTSKDESYFMLIHDIVNIKKYYNFDIEYEVVEFFIKNDKFIFLVDENDSIIEIPISGFRGDYYKKIGLLAGLGMNRSGPYSSVGPYFYFGNFDRSLRYAVLTVNGKPLEIMGKNITIENTPVYTKGGVVKYALFMGNSKVMMNLENDEEDDSYESIVLASEREFIKDTIKMRDTNGKWAKLYDSVVQPEVKLFDRELGIDRLLDPQFIVKTSQQQIPIDFAYFRTDHVTKNNDGMYNVLEATMI